MTNEQVEKIRALYEDFLTELNNGRDIFKGFALPQHYAKWLGQAYEEGYTPLISYLDSLKPGATPDNLQVQTNILKSAVDKYTKKINKVIEILTSE